MATATRLSSNGSSWASGGTTVASSSISPGANCFLVAFVTAVHDGSLASDQHPGTLVSSGSGPSWTSRADTAGASPFDAQGSVWTAAIGGSDPGSFTVTWTRAGGDSCGVRVMSIWKVTDFNAGTPQAGAIAVFSTTANGARTENVGATPASGDVVLMQALADDDDGNNSTITLDDSDRTWTDDHGGATTTIGAPWVTAQSTSSTSTLVEASDMNPGDAHDYTSVILAIIVKTADAGVTGTVAVTLAGATSSATGTETFTGSVAVTLAGATCAASGLAGIRGSVAVTLDDVTSEASGTHGIDGTVAVTLDGATADAAGTITITGSVAVTLDDATSSASGLAGIRGSVAVTLAGATCAASGEAGGVTGTVAVTLAGATSTLCLGVLDSFVKSVSGRRLLDHFGDDIIIRCMSSWGMAQNLADADITTALEGLQAKGFNAVAVQMFGYALNGTWDPYVAGNGQAVFAGTPYQSALGDGWESFDWVVSEAYRLGITVLASLYTAFGSTGPRADMEAASDAEMEDFGEAVATRYLQYENIVWHIGADDSWTTSDTIADRVEAFFTGVNSIEGASRRPVRVAEPNNGSTVHSQWPAWEGAAPVALTTNSLYDYTDDAVDNTDAVHNESGATTVPWWDCEPPYRFAGHYGSTTTVEPQEIRERLWTVIIRQGVGINYGHEDFWPFGATGLFSGGRTWEEVLTDPEVDWALYAWETFELVGNCAGWTRDTGGFITSGMSTGDTEAASAYKATFGGLVYMPTSRSIDADLTEFSGSFTACRISKIDPTTGTTTVVGTFATSGTQTIGALGNNASGTFSDWVLLFEGTGDVTGTVAKTLDGATCTASGAVVMTGTVAQTLAGATCAASGTETFTGTVASILAGATSTASGLVTITGSLAATLAGATCAASGTSLVNIVGTLAVTLDNVTCVASETPPPAFRTRAYREPRYRTYREPKHPPYQEGP